MHVKLTYSRHSRTKVRIKIENIIIANKPASEKCKSYTAKNNIAIRK